MIFPLEQHTIFMTLAGSQAHGTARDGSDVDLRGVCIAPLAVRLSLFSEFEQHEGPLEGALEARARPRLEAHPTASRGLAVKTECVVFDLAKFVRLSAAANPNALEILFADERDWVFDSPEWRKLHDQRHQFLTKKVQATFLGYAMAQLKKIKSHRTWLLHPPAHKPTREEFGLPPDNATLSRDDQNRIEQSIADKLRSYGIDDVEMPKASRIVMQERLHALVLGLSVEDRSERGVSMPSVGRDAKIFEVMSTSDEEVDERLRSVATRALNLPGEVVAALDAERKYRAAMKHWSSFQTWKQQRNPARAQLERAHGYDTKHAMHLVRLMRMGLEALEHGDLRVRRDDAAELSAIRDGALSFDALLDAAARLQSDMERAMPKTSLPDDVDYAAIDRLTVDLMTAHD